VTLALGAAMAPMTSLNCDSAIRAPILLVDDTPANLLGLQAVLAASEHELVSIRSGAEALAHLEMREFAVVLLDLQMPVMDGVETALKIRQLGEAQGRPVPIIFLTATDATVPRVLTAYASGAVDFIQKPLQPEILRSKVHIFADLYRARQRLVVEIEQRRRLQDALRARDELLAIVSHDLRNPLHAILLGGHQIERAAGENDWGRATKAAGAIAKAVDRMSRLVGALLDLATLDAGKPLAMDLGRHDLAELAGDIAELLEPIAQSNQLTLRTNLAAATYHVLCDRDRIQQVLANLIGNAIKFTDNRGTIDIDASAAEREDEVVVSVTDTGAGIRGDQVAHVFEAYWRAEPGRTSGAGLGLSIARAIVEAHGGRIWVETAEGAGSRFSFTLRSARSAEPPGVDVHARLAAGAHPALLDATAIPPTATSIPDG
jgi:signal transduction histidine kinase